MDFVAHCVHFESTGRASSSFNWTKSGVYFSFNIRMDSVVVSKQWSITISVIIDFAVSYACFSDCAPSTTFHLLRLDEEVFYVAGLRRSGFVCHQCRLTLLWRCYNCSLCPIGYYASDKSTNTYMYGSCQPCPAGNFYGEIWIHF